MAMFRLETVYKRIKAWKIAVKERNIQLFRFIEYKRLKRIRNHKSPHYSHCKNCGEKLLGIYCHKCGQYALDVDQSFFAYIRQFFENAYQFDGKAIQTVYNLFIRPGFLSKEFIAGKINSYVHPLKLYMCVSIIFFSFIVVIYSKDRYADELVEMIAVENAESFQADSIQEKVLAEPLAMTSGLLEQQLDTSQYSKGAHFSKTEKELIPWKKEVKNLYQDMFVQLSPKLPFLLLALLPVFAFLLRLFFRKTHRAYMSNFVFSVHIHTMLLILLTVAVLVNILTGIVSIYAWILVLFGIYVLLAIRGFYHNNWIKTILKTGIVSILYTFIFLVASTVLLVMILADLGDKY